MGPTAGGGGVWGTGAFEAEACGVDPCGEEAVCGADPRIVLGCIAAGFSPPFGPSGRFGGGETAGDAGDGDGAWGWEDWGSAGGEEDGATLDGAGVGAPGPVGRGRTPVGAVVRSPGGTGTRGGIPEWRLGATAGGSPRMAPGPWPVSGGPWPGMTGSVPVCARMGGSAARRSCGSGGWEPGAGVPIIALLGGVTRGGGAPLAGRGPCAGARASCGVNAVGVGLVAKCTGGGGLDAVSLSSAKISSGTGTMLVLC